MDRFGIMGNILAFIESVAGHWAFWIGLVLMVEPYLEGAFPSVAAWIKQLLVDDRRKRFFRVAGIIALLVAFSRRGIRNTNCRSKTQIVSPLKPLFAK